MTKNSQIRTTLASLSPLLIPILTMIATQIFSDATTKWAETFGAMIGYRLLFLICLFLTAGVTGMYILLNSGKAEGVQKEQAITPVSTTQTTQISEREIYTRRERILKNLANDEKETLRMFIDGNKKSIETTLGYGSYGSLINSGIMYMPSQITANRMVEYCISDWAWEMLKEHPQYLDC